MSDTPLLAHIASVGVTGEIRTEVLRIFCLYCCRTIDSDLVKKWLRSVAGVGKGKKLLEAKYALDDSTTCNDIWRALHQLSQYKRLFKKVIARVAKENNLTSEDLHELAHSLSRQDFDIILSARPFLRDPYSQAEMKFILSQLNAHFDRLAHHRLQFVANNDYSRDHADMVAELKSHAIRLIRHYEIEAETYQHMVNLVGRGVTNHATNLAIRSNRKSRQILTKLEEKPPFRQAWWFDTKTLTIRPVEVDSRAKRRVQKKKLSCQVRLATDGTLRYAQVDYLFENKQEATQAQFRYRRKGNGARRHILDLTPPKKNDYVPTTTSLSRPVGRDDSHNRMTLADVIPNPVNNLEEEADGGFVKRLNQEANTVVRRFLECVLGENRFFIDHLEAKGLDHATIGDKQLGREACWYLGVKLDDVKEGLRNVPQRVWSNDETRKTIYKQENEAVGSSS